MVKVKIGSAKLPLLLALPVLIVIGIVGFALQPDDPPANHGPEPEPILDCGGPHLPPDNRGGPITDPDPRPRPDAKPGAPTSAAEAAALELEAWASIEAIRARLELKYKYAEYQLDRGWTLEVVMRKLDALNTTNFAAADYTLTFPEGAEPGAVISCASRKGHKLADGALTMTVDLRTGRSVKDGRILARTADGYVLLGEGEYALMCELIRSAAAAHVVRQAASGEALAPVEGLIAQAGSFFAADFSAGASEASALAIEIACRTFRGEPLAEPGVLTLDYKARSASLSRVSAKSWFPVPEREELENVLRWRLRSIARWALTQVEGGKAAVDLRPEGGEQNAWLWQHMNLLPFDIQIVVDAAKPKRVELRIGTVYGQKLPFGRLTYVMDQEANTSGFEGSD